MSTLLLLLATLMVQDPKSKTVEDRLKELDDRLTVLEKRHRSLSDENAALEKQLADGIARQEAFEKATAAGWAGQYAAKAELTPEQTAALEALRLGWIREDRGKRVEPATWQAREAALRASLTAEQIPRFTRQVREIREMGVRSSVGFLCQIAKLSADKSGALEKAVLARCPFDDGVLLLEAHPGKTGSLEQVVDAIGSALPEVAPSLTDAEAKSLKGLLEQWKPKQR